MPTNFVKAITANAAAKASTGGAISVKRKDGKTVDLTLNGSFTNNRVETNATEALGGALYSEGMITLGNNTGFSAATAQLRQQAKLSAARFIILRTPR